MFFFFHFSQSDLREVTWHSALPYFTLSVGTCKSPRHVRTSCYHNCLLARVKTTAPFSQKATPIYLDNPELNFSPIEETYIFYQVENLKFVGTKKSTSLISLGHELKTRLNGGQWSDISRERKTFLSLFFNSLEEAHPRSNPDTHTHTHTHTHISSTSYSTWYKKNVHLCIVSQNERLEIVRNSISKEADLV